MTQEFVSGTLGDTPFELKRPEWQAKAACHPDVIPPIWQEFGEHPVDLFFPPPGQLTGAWSRAIESVCGTCPVRETCAAWGMDHEWHGFWGNTSANFRVKDRRVRGVVPDVPEWDAEFNKTIGTFIPAAHGTEERYQIHHRQGTDPCEACLEAHRLHLEPLQQARWAEKKRTETPQQRQQRLEAQRAYLASHPRHRA